MLQIIQANTHYQSKVAISAKIWTICLQRLSAFDLFLRAKMSFLNHNHDHNHMNKLIRSVPEILRLVCLTCVKTYASSRFFFYFPIFRKFIITRGSSPATSLIRPYRNFRFGVLVNSFVLQTTYLYRCTFLTRYVHTSSFCVKLINWLLIFFPMMFIIGSRTSKVWIIGYFRHLSCIEKIAFIRY